jgi:hypothetical protein
VVFCECRTSEDANLLRLSFVGISAVALARAGVVAATIVADSPDALPQLWKTVVALAVGQGATSTAEALSGVVA